MITPKLTLVGTGPGDEELIVALFMAYRGKQEAIALIQNGTCPNEKIALGHLADIEQIASDEGIQAPAILVIGAVVEKHGDFVKKTLDCLPNLPPVLT